LYDVLSGETLIQ